MDDTKLSVKYLPDMIDISQVFTKAVVFQVSYLSAYESESMLIVAWCVPETENLLSSLAVKALA